jgi:diguanylate cyclase (GGDEF)-like protein/PAS domain S-box-containing protein
MVPAWNWIALGVLAALAVYLQFRVYQVEREAKKRDELFKIVTENAADMIALVDVKGRRLYNSPAYKRILGYSAAELSATSAFDQIHPEDRFNVLQAAQEARSTGLGRKLEYRIRHKDGTWRVLESMAGTIRDENGDVAKLVIVNRDVTDRKRAEELAEHNSFHDGLTGLPNRRLFLDRLQNLFERSQRTPDRQYALLVADLDSFKALNDTLGTAIGDEVIAETGRRMETCLRDEDTISRVIEEVPGKHPVLSRMGGDEFTMLLEGVTDPSDAMRAAKRILSAMIPPIVVQGREVRASVSVGIALSNPAHKRADQLLQDADVAVRRAKTLGGARCEVFDEAMHTRAVNRLQLESELREALAKNEFRVYYQPVVKLDTKQITGFEALLRWQHPEQGLISPYKFIDAAEDVGLLSATGRWLILQACRQLREWEQKNPSLAAVNISVNLSAKQFADARFVPDLQSAIRESGVEPSRLQLEMTEDVAAADSKLTVTVVSYLKHLGIGVIIDNFGAGDCSLSGLRQFPIEALKIDRSLIGEMLADRGAYETVDLLLTLARKLKLQVIAEGIETAKQLESLRALGCDLGQGYFFSPPVAAEAAGALQIALSPAAQSKAARVQ